MFILWYLVNFMIDMFFRVCDKFYRLCQLKLTQVLVLSIYFIFIYLCTNFTIFLPAKFSSRVGGGGSDAFMHLKDIFQDYLKGIYI